MKLKPMTLLIIIAIVAFVALSGTITTVAIANSPTNASGKAITNMFEDFLERDDVKPFVEVLEGGSVELTLDGMKSGTGEDVFGGNSVAGKLYFSEDAIMLADVEIKGDEKKLAGEVYLSNDMIYLKESEILDIAIGGEFSKLADNFKDSIFSKDSDSDLALDEDMYDAIYETLESLDKIKNLGKDAEKLVEDVVEDIWDIILDNADVSSSSESIRLNGEKTKVRLINIEIDDRAVRGILEDVCDYLCDDKKIVKFIEDNEDLVLPVFRFAVFDDTDSLAELYEEWLDELADDVDDLCDEIEFDEKIELNIATPKASSKLLMLSLEYDGEEMFKLDCGEKGIKDTDIISFESPIISVTYEVKENNKEATEAELVIESYDSTYTISMDVNKERDTYTLKYKESEYFSSSNELSVKGEIATKGNTTTLTVEKILVDGEVLLELDCEIIVKTKDKMPSAPKNYDTIDDITEEDIEEWISKLAFGGVAYPDSDFPQVPAPGDYPLPEEIPNYSGDSEYPLPEIYPSEDDDSYSGDYPLPEEYPTGEYSDIPAAPEDWS